MPHDPRVDAYIAQRAPFARPILTHLRALVHAACPAASETIKWGRPFFLLDGRPLAMMAAFKAHASFGLWRGDGVTKSAEGAGDFGKLARLDDLPDAATLHRLIGEAAARIASGAPPPRAAAARPPIATPDDLTAALLASPAAQAGFAALPPGRRREYLVSIVEAKRPETRAKRIAATIAQLGEGKPLRGRDGA